MVRWAFSTAAAKAPCGSTSARRSPRITGYSFLVFNLLCAWFAIGYQCVSDPEGRSAAAGYAACFGPLCRRMQEALGLEEDACQTAVCAILAQSQDRLPQLRTGCGRRSKLLLHFPKEVMIHDRNHCPGGRHDVRHVRKHINDAIRSHFQ